jgi:transcriptional regulator with XRE-family HTH domain
MASGDRKVTATDVARRAGVSQSAVSRVFTPGASVSEAMARRVRAVAEELGYRPNVLARSLITGRTRIVGLVVGYLENPFYPEVLEVLSAALEALGYHILVFHAAGGEGEEDVERIVGRSRRGAISLDFRLRPGHGRRRWDLVSDRYIGDPRDVLEAIRDLAPDGGYTLEGHRLDVRFWGGEEWRLVPLDRPTIPAHRQGAPAGAPHSRPAGGVSGRSPAPCRSDAPR